MLFESLTDHNNKKLASSIDSTRLSFSSGVNEADSIRELCQEAIQKKLYAVCIRPVHCLLAKQLLYGSPVKLACVVGFPEEKVSLNHGLDYIGHVSLALKQKEAEDCIRDGADELDWVLNIQMLKQDIHRHQQEVSHEFMLIRNIAEYVSVKVIIETDLLLMPEIVKATQACATAHAAMVKTSTGMLIDGEGATLENIRLINKTLQALNTDTTIKASGGIKTRDQALLLLEAGASRIGTSNASALLESVSQQAL